MPQNNPNNGLQLNIITKGLSNFRNFFKGGLAPRTKTLVLHDYYKHPESSYKTTFTLNTLCRCNKPLFKNIGDYNFLAFMLEINMLPLMEVRSCFYKI